MLNGGCVRRIFFLLLLALPFESSFFFAASKNVVAATELLDTVVIPHAPVIDTNEWQELECDLLVANFDRSQTGFGFWGLRELLWPIADIQRLANRQTVIRALVEDEQFFAQVQGLLKAIAQDQERVLAYWQEHEDLFKRAKSLYYSMLGSYSAKLDEKLNNSRVALECATVIDGVKKFWSLALLLAVDGIILETLEKGSKFSIKGACGKVLSYVGMLNSPKPNIFTPERIARGDGDMLAFLSRAPFSAGDWYYAFSRGSKDLPSRAGAVLGAGLMTAFADASLFTQGKDSINSLREFIAVLNELQSHMVGVARFLKNANKLRLLFEKKCGPALQQVSLSCEGLPSDRRKELVQLLKAGTFSKESTSFYSRGRVLLAHKRMNEVKNEFIPLLQLVGQMDAYCSLARLYKERQNAAGGVFSFAHFMPGSHALLSVNECWIPACDTKNSVKNSIAWGTAQHRENKIIITGPNGCGKSTIMKAVAWNILLAQSWGIVPASAAELSIFGCIKTSLNPQENLQKGLSTFMAEKCRMDSIEAFLHNWQGNQPVLLLLDEPYHGTIGLEASERIMQFGARQVDKPWCMLVMATHLQAVTTLAEKMTGIFANYCFDAVLDDTGTFTRTFMLQPGVAHWWFNDLVKRRRFIDQLGAQ